MKYLCANLTFMNCYKGIILIQFLFTIGNDEYTMCGPYGLNKAMIDY